MKHKTIAVGIFAIGIALFPFLIAEANAQLPDRVLSVGSLASELTTPEKIAKYMWRHFSFETDQRQFGTEDYWQSPEEFLQNRRGDCEDFAQFAYQILKLNGFKAFLLNLYGQRYAHTVCVVEKDGKYFVFDGSRLKQHEASSLQELSSKIYSFWKTGNIVVPDHRNRASIRTEFKKQSF